MKRRALFIGVNEYKDPEIRNLSCSVRDANSMHDIFELLGYETRLLENPSQVDVFNAIRAMTTCDGGLKPGDLFVMYFAGHGFTDSGQHLLFCADDMYSQLRHHRSGIPFDQIEEATRGGYGRAFLLDACQSDFLTGTKGGGGKARTFGEIGEMVPDAKDAPGDYYVLRSCSKYEYSLEVESRGHGLFTLGMLDVLRQSQRTGSELLFDDSLRLRVSERMQLIANDVGITMRQKPKSVGCGSVLILTSGRKASQAVLPSNNQPVAAPEKKTAVVVPVKPQAPAKPAEDVHPRPPSPPSAEELRRIEELGREMFAKKRAALRRRGELDPYRQDSAGLLFHLQEADRLLERISSASPFATLADTENAARALDGDIEALGRELAWLKENKAWRDEARSLSKSVDSLDADLARFKAAELAYAAYTSGMLARTQAKAEFDADEFFVAKTRYADAKKSLSEAVKTARSTLANLELEDARGLAERCQWKDCIAACDRALAIDPKCDEAARLKAKARDEEDRVCKEEKERRSKKVKEERRRKFVKWFLVGLGISAIACAVTIFLVKLYADAAERKNRETLEAAERAERQVREEAERKAREEAAWRAYQEEESRKAGITKTLTLPGGAEMELVYCPPGEFMMGSPISEEGRIDNKKQHRVRLTRRIDNETQHRVRLTRGFWLGKYPVTQRQWKSVMGSNPSKFKGDDLPVEDVSWDDCQKFIKKVKAALGCGARLPTEAEWEYACRAGTTGAYGGSGNLDEMGWFGGNSGRTTHPVGQKKPNAWGLCDMHGNVWEWCADWYGNYSGDAVDPTGPASGGVRVLRGGGWSSDARYCRSADRDFNVPCFRYDYYGFRLCCSVGPRGPGAEP